MAIRMTRNAGMLLLAIWLILTGIAGFAAVAIPGALMSALALAVSQYGYSCWLEPSVDSVVRPLESTLRLRYLAS